MNVYSKTYEIAKRIVAADGGSWSNEEAIFVANMFIIVLQYLREAETEIEQLERELERHRDEHPFDW